MSWKASAWAKQQRLGSPAAKSILMCLADYADPTGLINGWASQAQLAEDAEITDRAVRGWMQKLEDWGLMRRRRRNGARGERASDIIQLNLDVFVVDGAARLKKDKDGASDDGKTLPENTSGRAYRNEDASLPEADDSPTGTEFRAYKEEPPISTQYPPEERGARARDDVDREESQSVEASTDDPAKFEKRVKKLAADLDWPGWARSSTAWTVAQFAKLTDAERAEAERRAPQYIAENGRKALSLGTYFAERKWTDLPEPAQEKPPALEAKAFGKLWQAARLKQLIAGPTLRSELTAFQRRLVAEGQADEAAVRLESQAKTGFPAVNRMHEQASYGRGVVVAPELEPLAELMERVRVGSELWEAWLAEHEARGWPWLPDPGKQEWVYFPAGGPQAGLRAFEAALRQDGNDRGQEAAE